MENTLKMKNYVLLLALVISFSAQSANDHYSVKFGEPSEQKIGDFALASKAIVSLGTPIDLGRVAAGIRNKTFLKIKVYVLQVFSTNAAIQKSNGDSAIESLLQKNQTVALSLTFIRNVEAKQIVDAYKESLAANNIKSDEEPFKNFLEEVQKKAESKKGVTLWFVLKSDAGVKGAAGKEHITFFTEGKESVAFEAATGSNFLKNFLSIWFGKTTDGGLESLKEQLLK